MEKLLQFFTVHAIGLLCFSSESPNVCMAGQNCSLGLFYLLEGTDLDRNILGQTPSTLILLALCSICLFLCFPYSFHPSPASFSSSAVLTLSCSAFCCGTNIHPLISVHKSRTEISCGATASSPPQGNSNN